LTAAVRLWKRWHARQNFSIKRWLRHKDMESKLIPPTKDGCLKQYGADTSFHKCINGNICWHFALGLCHRGPIGWNALFTSVFRWSRWYVCSDYPVGLFYSLTVSEDPLEHQKAIEWPTLSPFKSPIFMPLAYNVAIAIHRSENIPTALRADRRMVARVNTVVVGYSQRFICSPSLDFTCVLQIDS